MDARAKGGKELVLEKPYDATVFWTSVAEDYYKTFKQVQQFQANTPWLIDRMRVMKVESVLDVGCSFGRVLPFLFQAGCVKKATGIDIAPKSIDCSRKYLENSECAKNITIELGDARRMSYDSDSFDCVFCSEVLQHLREEDAQNVLREMIRVSRKYVLLIERWAFPGEHAEPHLWSYIYPDWLKSMGVEILQVCGLSQNIQGVVAKKRGM